MRYKRSSQIIEINPNRLKPLLRKGYSRANLGGAESALELAEWDTSLCLESSLVTK